MIKLTPPMGWNSWNTFGENINLLPRGTAAGQSGSRQGTVP